MICKAKGQTSKAKAKGSRPRPRHLSSRILEAQDLSSRIHPDLKCTVNSNFRDSDTVVENSYFSFAYISLTKIRKKFEVCNSVLITDKCLEYKMAVKLNCTKRSQGLLFRDLKYTEFKLESCMVTNVYPHQCPHTVSIPFGSPYIKICPHQCKNLNLNN